MFASAHLAAGAVVGLLVARRTTRRARGVIAAFAVGFLSHLPMDAVPHGDYAPLTRPTIVRVVLVEAIVMCALVGWIVRGDLRLGAGAAILAGMVGATLPDAKFGARLLLPEHAAQTVTRVGDRFHELFHAPPPVSPLAGWAAELVATALLLLALTRLRRAPTSSPRAAPASGSR